MRELQTELKELRQSVGGKAEQQDLAALDTRMDSYATQKVRARGRGRVRARRR